MKKRVAISILAALVLTIIFSDSLHAQGPDFMRDDFLDRKEFWIYHDAGAADPAEILNGYAKLLLSNPSSSEGSNCGIGQIEGRYFNFTYRARIKALTPLMPGTHGWGLWLQRDWTDGINWAAWFMEQNDPSGDPLNNFWSASTANGPASTAQSCNLEGIIDNQEWHTYEIEKTNDRVDFFVDGNLVCQMVSEIQQFPLGHYSKGCDLAQIMHNETSLT